MSKYKVEISGINTNDIVVLSQNEMTKLFESLKENNPFARDLLVQGNLKLVLSILKKFGGQTENMDDLFQIGCVGLIKAIDNFDLSHNVKFSTYAVPMILGEIKRYIRDNNSSIRISRSIKDLAYKALKLQEQVYNETGKTLTPQEISHQLNSDIYDVVLALEALKEPVSMYEPIYNDGGDTIYFCDQIEDKRTSDNEISTKLAIESAIDDLEQREKYILDQRYIIGKTQMEIANELNISQAQVSRLEKGAIKTLKKTLK